MNFPKYLLEPDAPDTHSYGVVEYRDRHYHVHAEPSVLQLVKRMFPGSKSRDGVVTFPDTRRAVGDLNWLLLRFPMEIKCSTKFHSDRNRAIDHAIRRETNHNVAPVTDPAGFVGQLMPFQADGVAFLKANERTLLADDMGLGKTVQALASLSETGAFPAVVVCTPNLCRQWRDMAHAFLAPRQPEHELFSKPVECHILRGLKPYALPPASIYIIHYGILRAWRHQLRDLNPGAVIFDEVQELRYPNTEKYSAASLVAESARYVWALSGTPVYNLGGEIWSVLNIVDYHCLGDFDSFTREWCCAYGSKQLRKPEVLGDYLKREGLMIRRRKEDVQSQLPPKRRVVMSINHDDALYDRMIQPALKLARDYAGITGWHERGQALREIDTQARQATGISKAPYVAAFVRGLLEAGERVLLYAWHHGVHETLMRDLADYKPAKLTGAESPAQKDEAKRRFISGETPVIILSLRTTAGIDGLQDVGTCCVFAELDWSPAVHSQCEDRLHRIGISADLESILCYYLVADTGTDEVMQEALGLKIGQFIGLMGDTATTEQDKADALRAAEKHIDRVVDRLRSRAHVKSTAEDDVA